MPVVQTLLKKILIFFLKIRSSVCLNGIVTRLPFLLSNAAWIGMNIKLFDKVMAVLLKLLRGVAGVGGNSFFLLSLKTKCK